MISKSKILFVLLCGLFFSGTLIAKMHNQVFPRRSTHLLPEETKTYLSLRNVAYFKNNEFFHEMVDGYTLFGLLSQPKLNLKIDRFIEFSLGISANWDFGSSNINKIEPMGGFTFRTERSTIIIGTLRGGQSHQLLEPLSDFEIELVDPVENGIQYIYDGPGFWLDVWFDWQDLVRRGQDDHEDLVGGISGLAEVFFGQDSSINIAAQAKIYHHGGQNSVSNLKAYTQISAASGVEVELSKRYYTAAYGLIYNQFAGDLENAFEKGHGYLAVVGARNIKLSNIVRLDSEASFWHGDKFHSHQGGAFYSSESSNIDNPGLASPQNQLLNLKVDFKPLKKLAAPIKFRLETYYDLRRERFDFSSGIYVQWLPQFKL